VRRVAARRVAAEVVELKAKSYGSNEKFIGRPMRQLLPAFHADNPVVLIVSTGGPNPAVALGEIDGASQTGR
jgi:hypothetical protein